MNDTSYADKINNWQITAQNLLDLQSSIPGFDPPFNDFKQKVEDLRASHDKVQMLRGALHESVVLRRKLDQETRRSARRLAAVTRGHLGFDNPRLVSFNFRSEDSLRRGRKAKASAPAVPVANAKPAVGL